MNSDIYILLILLLPLLSFLFIGLSGRKLSTGMAVSVGCLTLITTLIFSIAVAFDYFFVKGSVGGVYAPQIVARFEWLRFSPGMSIDLGLIVDPISVMMLLVITCISTMVNIFSIGYMKGEERLKSYYAYLSLFTFSMLGLVLSINIFQMYIFWELVGISSFLLIGFFFNKPSAIAAAKKAFIVTRFADFGFLIGILILGTGAKTFDFLTLIDRLTHPGVALDSLTGSGFLGMSCLTWALILVFMGGAGKSAMFPLHIWLPDAMEGPTPVSALIHAATMVVAGVFLVARLFPIYSISAPEVLQGIAYIGSFTALFSALIACAQTDIKKVLAYSTISQIGFMMFALGVAGWGEGHDEGFTASMFHLFTHAFFKALLFLCAGSVIHAVHSNEMKDMGGLRKSMPITHITFLLACLAIAGIPPFSGFFSKEAILSAAAHGNPPVFYVGLFTSALTSFYMFRLYFSIFWSKPVDAHAHNHEKGQWAMNIPLILLAIGAVLAGLIPFGKYVSATGKAIELPIHVMFSVLPVCLGLGGILVAAFMYKKQNEIPQKVTKLLGNFYEAAYKKFFIDEIYLFLTHKVIFNLIGRPAAWFDRNVVDGMIQRTGSTSVNTSNAIKNLQSGKLQGYTMYFLGGVIVLVVLILIKFL
ncbi:MAG: NADH-quinone oxidoreductase subunit L [Bacteroidota bacterium]|nr:NADH-quinone oxidoreductase subunit L [Bacteroidota bacterium]